MDPSASISPSLAAPLHDAVRLFTRLNIPYALVGGIAAMVYGRARFTEDIDFVAASSHASILQQNPQIMRECRFDPACTWKLYHETGIEIDLWKDVYSDEIVARGHEIPLGEQSVRIADPHDLIAMKLRANRLQDDYDISEILKHTAIDETNLASLITAGERARFDAIKARTSE
jgi:hypothetical protein